uniref:Transmembrane protein n=1 Tax=Panagrellus redivivus TaxID=6233 RepID=A0A7E4UXI4_PANRE
MQRLIEVAEDESDSFLVCCGAMHAVPAVLSFFIVDFSCVIATFAIYVKYIFASPSWTNLIPSTALLASLSIYPIGPLGFALQRLLFLRIYKWRLRAIGLWSFFWMFIVLFLQDEVIGIAVAVIWLLAAVLYLIGGSFVATSIDFMLDYKGYDGADPAVMDPLPEKYAETPATPGTVTNTAETPNV